MAAFLLKLIAGAAATLGTGYLTFRNCSDRYSTILKVDPSDVIPKAKVIALPDIPSGVDSEIDVMTWLDQRRGSQQDVEDVESVIGVTDYDDIPEVDSGPESRQ